VNLGGAGTVYRAFGTVVFFADDACLAGCVSVKGVFLGSLKWELELFPGDIVDD
jgi:hypothetical protein